VKKFLQQALENNGFYLSEEIQHKILTYLDLLQHWNRAFNLTAISDPKDMVLLHIVDSLSINPYLQGARIVDVGTGAGFPGIPLALLNPEKHFLLIDSNSKKTRFLTHVIHELKLTNVEVLHVRCEDFHPQKCFDTIVSRAFASIQVMLATTQHLICADGQFLAMKGVYPEKEIAEIPDEFRVLTVHGLKINGLDAERCLVCITKND
jgi:16S rRNA (guanine527-N7)-methyltransferase